jgi:hypothetical protein
MVGPFLGEVFFLHPIRIRLDSFVLSFPVVGNRGVVVGDP